MLYRPISIVRYFKSYKYSTVSTSIIRSTLYRAISIIRYCCERYKYGIQRRRRESSASYGIPQYEQVSPIAAPITSPITSPISSTIFDLRYSQASPIASPIRSLIRQASAIAFPTKSTISPPYLLDIFVSAISSHHVISAISVIKSSYRQYLRIT